MKKIIANAEVADKEAAGKTAEKKADKPASASGDEKTASPSTKGAVPVPVAGVKRSATASTGEGTAAKKLATGANKANGVSAASKVNGVAKKPAASSETSKSTNTATNTTTNAAATRKTVVAKPSGFFSSLQSASKKPGTSNADKAASSAAKPASKAPGAGSSAPKPAFSFAETMANLAKPKEEKPIAKPQKEAPPETPEEREKRLRKEKRRKLHVTFKTGDDLVQVRYFTHDPQEEIGHDSSQMRDMADVGGEGRMLKQHAHMMDIDDEDEIIAEVENLKEHRMPSLIDFSVVDVDERKRNYAPYGGGELEPESAERAVRDEYEHNNLIVFYTDPSQIPPNPREPNDPYNGDPGETLRYFGSPEEMYSARAQAKTTRQPPHGQPSPGFDISAFMQKQQQQSQQQQSAPMNHDVMSILASLQKSAPAQATLQQQNVPEPYPGGQRNNVQPAAAPPSQPPGGLDLGAILASLNAGNNQQGNYNSSNAAPMMGFGQQQPMTGNVNNGPGDSDVATIKANNPWYKTKPCRFWQDGRCQKGDSCSYVHE